MATCRRYCEIGPYRFFFYAGDRNEPQHVHIERDNNLAKFWLEPVRLQAGGGFSRGDLARLHRLVEEKRFTIEELE